MVLHGLTDLHTGNVAFLTPTLTAMSASDWMKNLDDIQAIPVLSRRDYNQATNHSLPKYVVESADLYEVVKRLVSGPEKEVFRAVITDFGNGMYRFERFPLCKPTYYLDSYPHARFHPITMHSYIRSPSRNDLQGRKRGFE
jgi:hypothetical protein